MGVLFLFLDSKVSETTVSVRIVLGAIASGLVQELYHVKDPDDVPRARG